MTKVKNFKDLGEGMALVRGGVDGDDVYTDRDCTCSYYKGRTNDAEGKKEKDGCACGCWQTASSADNDKANDAKTPDLVNVSDIPGVIIV